MSILNESKICLKNLLILIYFIKCLFPNLFLWNAIFCCLCFFNENTISLTDFIYKKATYINNYKYKYQNQRGWSEMQYTILNPKLNYLTNDPPMAIQFPLKTVYTSRICNIYQQLFHLFTTLQKKQCLRLFCLN